MAEDLAISISKKCKFVRTDNSDNKLPCEYLAIEGKDYCIFHIDDILLKEKYFQEAIDKLLDEIDNDVKIVSYDFRGFIFPKVSFKNREFKKVLDLQYSKFADLADFENCHFRSRIKCRDTFFGEKAFFQGARFGSEATFVNSTFKKLIFVGGDTKNKVVFHACKFFENAAFQGRTFLGDVKIMGCTFFDDVDFSRVKFKKNIHFEDTKFKGSVSFSGAEFSEEIIFRKMNVAKLKDINGEGIKFDSAVILSANLHSNDSFQNFSFRDSILISCDLSGKPIRNCDFTGAVLKNVMMTESAIDAKTCANTKFIYLDYEVVGEQKEKEYRPKLDTRVPSEGDFDDNKNPKYTLKEFYRESTKWSYNLNLPQGVRTGIENYINFFKEYVNATENIKIGIAINPEGERTKISIIPKDDVTKSRIDPILGQFIERMFQPFDTIEVEFRNENLKAIEKEKFLMNYHNTHSVTGSNIAYGLNKPEELAKEMSLLVAQTENKELRKQNEMYQNFINQLITSKAQPINLTVSTEAHMIQKTNVEVETSININIELELSRLITELNEAKQTVDNRFIKELLEQAESVKAELQKEKDVGKIKPKVMAVVKGLGKLIDYGIRNYDTLKKIGDELQKML